MLGTVGLKYTIPAFGLSFIARQMEEAHKTLKSTSLRQTFLVKHVIPTSSVAPYI